MINLEQCLRELRSDFAIILRKQVSPSVVETCDKFSLTILDDLGFFND